ncbi:peptide deformylase [Streptomyces sp. NPDC059650]|uniref:peptide deformylase n=1 Tax=Streptomyces sp. NPDC059650 TaxID=3346896 RepID=UPI00367F713E
MRAARPRPVPGTSWPAPPGPSYAAPTRTETRWSWSGQGFFVRCLQHETDHLNGTLYIDHLTPEQHDRRLAETAESGEAVRAGRLARARLLGG